MTVFIGPQAGWVANSIGQLGDGMWNEKQPKAGRPLDDRREY